MAQCHIIPDQWSVCGHELRLLWRRWEARGQLIDLDLAREYFVTPEFEIDATGDQLVIGPVNAV